MDDLAKAFSTTWPFLMIGALALAAIFALLKAQLSGLKTTLGELRQEQQKLHAKFNETDGRIDNTSRQQTALAERIDLAQREFEAHRLATDESLLAAAASRGGAAADGATLECPADSIERFNAAADALSQVAKELEGFDWRQAENWLRIRGDLEEQAFALQRVQQHVDRLFAPVQEPVAIAPASAAAAAD